MTSATTPVSTNLLEYSGFDLVAETQNGAAITRTYDGLGRPAGFNMGSAYIAAYGYDTFGRFASVSSYVASVSSVANYSYVTGSGLVASMTNSAGFWWQRTYEQNRDLIASVENGFGGDTVSDFAYGNDANGRRVRRVDSGAVTNLFGLNARSEVVSAVLGGSAYAYGHDAIGNRVWLAFNAVTNTYAANNLNQYTAITGAAPSYPTYDADGNLVSDGVFTYVWDAENRPICVSNAQHTVDYAYDWKGRMILKSVDGSSACLTWDGWNLVTEVVANQQTTTTNHYVWGLDLSGSLQGAGGVGGLLAVFRGGTPYYPCYDANGNVTEYVDTNGDIVAHREYSAFGETTALTGVFADDFTFWWSTKPWCPVTGLSEYELRKYRPDIGRWISTDPMGEKGFQLLTPDALVEADVEGVSRVLVTTFDNAAGYFSDDTSIDATPNVYLFVFNAPISLKDRLGLNITLETGNQAPWQQILNNLVHQQICVDVWQGDSICTENNKWECCHKGKTCFSFGKIEGTSGVQTPQFSQTWLGWNSIVIGAILKGEIYEADPIAGASIKGTHTTTMKQDNNWLVYMRNRSGTQDAYSVGNHNCRRYSQWEFRDASRHW